MLALNELIETITNLLNIMENTSVHLNKKKVFMLFFGFVTTLVFAQEKPQFEVKEDIFEVGIFHNTFISEKMTLQKGLRVKKNMENIPLEIPILLRMDNSERLSTFVSVQTTPLTLCRNSSYNIIENASSPFFSMGTDYEFKNESVGNLTLNFPLRLDFGFKF